MVVGGDGASREQMAPPRVPIPDRGPDPQGRDRRHGQGTIDLRHRDTARVTRCPVRSPRPQPRRSEADP